MLKQFGLPVETERVRRVKVRGLRQMAGEGPNPAARDTTVGPTSPLLDPRLTA